MFHEKNTNDDKKKTISYYASMILLIFILNWVVVPMLFSPRQVTTSYSEFLKNIESDKVAKVQFSDKEINYVVNDNGVEKYYKTGIILDPNLSNNLKEKNVEFGAVIPEKPNVFLNMLLSWVLPILIFWGIGRLISRNLQSKIGGNGLNINGQNSARIYKPDDDKKTFVDVAGADEAKESLQEIIDYLEKPGKYKDIGAECPKGVLLVGPPGTGKTLMAKAVAGEAGVPFFSISGSEFVEMFVGRGAAKVRDLFSQASKLAPCIVFIDEIDTIGKKRDGNFGGNDEREQTLNQLLTEMDGFAGNKGVIILAATNRPEVLDPALLRPGRFDRQVPIELPDLRGRTQILKVHLKKIKTEGEIDLNLISRMTSGASGAQLANIVNEAALRAVRMNRSEVNTGDLEESVEVVIAGQQKKNVILSDEEKKIVSYHEIGHALVAAMEKGSAPVQKITIIPRTSGALGYTMQVEEGDKSLLSKEEIIQKIEVLCGGRAAEEIVFNKISTGASNDIEKATKLARSMVTKYGMSEKFGMVALETTTNQYLGGDSSLICSAETSYEIDKEVLEIIKNAHMNAKLIINNMRDKLDELANYLLEKETITGEEFMSILKK
ncbi:ATP-dependent zinc metalloprotease FtsH [Fusobacterium sp. PH5-44]|uniref:ATP-dependent zinc metalloprotease FtsH n=1 Tax=unclassified Fusobacterium TaxID=2648384 RepID=UPI003D1ED365